VDNTEGHGNVASGVEALGTNKEGNFNVASGYHALDFSNGSRNVASGFAALFEAFGNDNVGIGSSAGSNLFIGSNNVDISNNGVRNDEGAIRIGTEGKQTKAFVAGVYPTHVVGCTVQVTSEGQLGCNPVSGATGATGPTGSTGPTGAEGKEGKAGATGATGSAGTAANAAIATFASTEGVPSGRCLTEAFGALGANGKCPPKTVGWSPSPFIAGPMPANGAVVSNVYADTNASVSGSDKVEVAVIDNTTGSTLLSCTVNSTSKNHCSNTGSSGSVAAGNNIEVKVTASGPSGNNKSWRVRFRY
jgi:hypothetical protein